MNEITRVRISGVVLYLRIIFRPFYHIAAAHNDVLLKVRLFESLTQTNVCTRLPITASNPIFCRSPPHSFSSVLAILQCRLPQLMNTKTEVSSKAQRTTYENGFMRVHT